MAFSHTMLTFDRFLRISFSSWRVLEYGFLLLPSFGVSLPPWWDSHSPESAFISRAFSSVSQSVDCFLVSLDDVWIHPSYLSNAHSGVVFYLSMWYKRSEQHYRIALFFSAASLAGAFGGIFAYVSNLQVLKNLEIKSLTVRKRVLLIWKVLVA